MRGGCLQTHPCYAIARGDEIDIEMLPIVRLLCQSGFKRLSTDTHAFNVSAPLPEVDPLLRSIFIHS